MLRVILWARLTVQSPTLAHQLGSSRISDAILDELLLHITTIAGAHDRISVQTPSTGEVFGHIPATTPADLQLAVTRARSAQPGWSARSFEERRRIFLRFHDLLLARQDEVLDLIQLETGKARRHAFEEVLDTAVIARYYANHGEKLLR